MTDPWATFVPDLLSQGLASLIGAGLAAGVAILVAIRQIKAERRAREADDALIRAEQIRSVRGSAVHEVLFLVSPLIHSGRRAMRNRSVDVALSSLLIDGTKDSYNVYVWVRWQLGPANQANHNVTGLSMTYDIVRAMMLEWIQPGEAGVLASI